MIKWEIKYEKINLKKMNDIYLKLVDQFNFENEIKLIDVLKTDEDFQIYNSVKSWRSNVVEGNTTKIVKLKQIIKEDNNIVRNKAAEELEIVNLIKAYSIDKLTWNLGSIQNVNYILGDKIEHNDFYKYRGKLKLEENYIFYKDDSDYSTYTVYFCHPNDVKSELKKLFSFVNENFNENLSFTNVLCLATIFNLEFNRIHPFMDGNGRTSRVFFELIFERAGFLPLIFSTKESKKNYKDLLLTVDVKSIVKKNKYYYDEIISSFANLYQKETQEFLKAIKKMNNI